MKTRLSFVNVINLHSTVSEEEVCLTEFGVFNFLNLQVANLQYVPIYLCLNIFHFSHILWTIEDPNLTSILLYVCI